MKLTPEQVFDELAIREEVESGSSDSRQAMYKAFLAGCRYQHQITLERAAKVCDGQHWLRAFANAIRALPFEDKP